MKPHLVLKIAVQLEKDIADFYKRLSKVIGLEKYHDVFINMSKHSQLHANIINGLVEEFKIPELDVSPMQELNEKIKRRLTQHLANETDIAAGQHKLAEAEDIIGKMYLTISAYYERIGQTYQKASKQFNKLAEDEQRHRDQLLEEIR